jgi:hypothetical protein
MQKTNPIVFYFLSVKGQATGTATIVGRKKAVSYETATTFRITGNSYQYDPSKRKLHTF